MPTKLTPRKRKRAKKVQPRKLYLLTLTGMGDTDIRFVDKPTWDWIQNIQVNQSAPPAVVELAKKQFDDEEWEPNITEGTPENDAALQAPAVELKKGQYAQFFDMRSAMKFIRDNNIDIVDEFEGGIY